MFWPSFQCVVKSVTNKIVLQINTNRRTISIMQSLANQTTLSLSNDNMKSKLAVLQLTSTSNKSENFDIARKLIEQAAQSGCKMIFLPECFDFICRGKENTFEQGEPLNGPIVTRYQSLANEHRIWLSLGGLHEKDVDNPSSQKLFNAHIIINDKGEIVSVYRKVHLFNLDIPGTRLIESEFSKPGDTVFKPIQTPVGQVGQGICYDVRFPEFAFSLAKGGADILTVSCFHFYLNLINSFNNKLQYPSSFTVPTGQAHWHTLLRTRAIENQCYVVAAAQSGKHHETRSSYGHSIVIGPWGDILAEVEATGPGMAIAEIDFNHLSDVRKRLPVFTDRRPDVYGNVIPATKVYSHQPKALFEGFQFGEKALVTPEQVFVKTAHSIGFVNHRPLLPGHVLVAPLRPNVKRFADLNSAEVLDLFLLVQKVQKVIETIFCANSSTIAIQDGPEAGQSIDHLHVHLVPRKADDFGGKTDEIYARLQKHDKNDSEHFIKMRTLSEMEQESERLRKYF